MNELRVPCRARIHRARHRACALRAPSTGTGNRRRSCDSVYPKISETSTSEHVYEKHPRVKVTLTKPTVDTPESTKQGFRWLRRQVHGLRRVRPSRGRQRRWLLFIQTACPPLLVQQLAPWSRYLAAPLDRPWRAYPSVHECYRRSVATLRLPFLTLRFPDQVGALLNHIPPLWICVLTLIHQISETFEALLVQRRQRSQNRRGFEYVVQRSDLVLQKRSSPPLRIGQLSAHRESSFDWRIGSRKCNWRSGSDGS